MCSGSSLHVECILPPGMLCQSAWRMMFLKNVFVVCMSGGGCMSEKAASVSVVNCVQSCILDLHQQTASHAECSIENCHMMHTRHQHTTSA